MQAIVHPNNEQQLGEVKGIDNVGTFNEMPKPYKEITETEFWAEFVTYPPSHVEHRQVCNFLDYKTMRNTRIHWWDDKGVAVLLPQEQRGGVYCDLPRYFRLGCEHNWREVPYDEAKKRGLHHDGYQFHLSECTKCDTRHGAHSDD